MSDARHFSMERVTGPDEGKLRRSAGAGVRAAVWVVALLALLALLAVGIGWSLRHRFSIQSPGVSPELPTLPGKTPEPKNP
jgi:type VI protein secretion system component VasF